MNDLNDSVNLSVSEDNVLNHDTELRSMVMDNYKTLPFTDNPEQHSAASIEQGNATSSSAEVLDQNMTSLSKGEVPSASLTANLTEIVPPIPCQNQYSMPESLACEHIATSSSPSDPPERTKISSSRVNQDIILTSMSRPELDLGATRQSKIGLDPYAISESLADAQDGTPSYMNSEAIGLHRRALTTNVEIGRLNTTSAVLNVLDSHADAPSKIHGNEYQTYEAKVMDRGQMHLAQNKFSCNPVTHSSTTELMDSNVSLQSTSMNKSDEKFSSNYNSLHILRRLGKVFSPRKAIEELRSPMLWHDVIVETVLCMYYECLIIFISVTYNSSIYKPSITHFGLYAGFFVFLCIEGWGPMCGASVNPARTWAVFLAGQMTFIKALIYTIAEVGGAAAGTMIGYGLTPGNGSSQIIPLLPGEGVSAVQGMAIEAVLTFNLIFVGLVLGQPTGTPSATASLTIGFCVGTGVMAAGTHTGGLQNPIVAFGPAIISGNFTDHWLYWAGPYVGATVATAFYLLLKLVRDTYDPKTLREEKIINVSCELATEL